MRYVYAVFVFALAASTLVWQADAGGLQKSDSKVKASASATKIEGGKQPVAITLDMDKGWSLYANPVNHNNDFLEANQTTVKVGAKDKVQFKPKYPAGEQKVDKTEKYDVYKGVVKIEVAVQRTKGDTSPLEITIDVNACDSSVCLMPGKIKLMVP